MSETFLPYGRQSINQDDIDSVVEALKSELLTTGPRVELFESLLAEYCGSKYAIVVSNGTAALHLGMLTLNLRPTDVVIVPSVTFVASANAAAFCGARVIFADTDPKTGLITNQAFDEAVLAIPNGFTLKAVVPVHLAGRPINIDYIRARCLELGAMVIEDACHALGSKGAQGMIGNCKSSDMACLSFHPVKTLTTAEGGAILVNDAVLAARLRALRAHGIERDSAQFQGLGYGFEDVAPWVYEMQVLGYNYRLPDLNCALGISQMRRLNHFCERRQSLVSLYQKAISPHSQIIDWVLPDQDQAPVFHLMAVLIDFKSLKPRAQVMTALKANSIGSQVHYIPVHRQPYWQLNQLVNRPLPGADAYYAKTLSLPLYPEMGDYDPQRVIDRLVEILS